MPNPTPQQRIEELVREFTDSIIENYPPRHRNSLSRDMLTYDLQHIATQAYLAGLEDVVQAWKDYDDVYGRDIEAHISQLKEQINK